MADEVVALIDYVHHEETRRRGSLPDIMIKLAYKRYMCVHVAADWLHVLDRQIGSIYLVREAMTSAQDLF